MKYYESQNYKSKSKATLVETTNTVPQMQDRRAVCEKNKHTSREVNTETPSFQSKIPQVNNVV